MLHPDCISTTSLEIAHGVTLTASAAQRSRAVSSASGMSLHIDHMNRHRATLSLLITCMHRPCSFVFSLSVTSETARCILSRWRAARSLPPPRIFGLDTQSRTYTGPMLAITGCICSAFARIAYTDAAVAILPSTVTNQLLEKLSVVSSVLGVIALCNPVI